MGNLLGANCKSEELLSFVMYTLKMRKIDLYTYTGRSLCNFLPNSSPLHFDNHRPSQQMRHDLTPNHHLHWPQSVASTPS